MGTTDSLWNSSGTGRTRDEGRQITVREIRSAAIEPRSQWLIKLVNRELSCHLHKINLIRLCLQQLPH